MSYMGKVRPTIALLTDDIADDQVTSAKIADTTIVNADVNASAAIVQSKLATLAITDSEVADNALSGNKIDGGTISNFASTGIDDNAAATTLTVSGGNTVPAVEIDGTSTDVTSLKIDNSTSRAWNIAVGGSAHAVAGGFSLYDYTAGANRLFINTSGAIGVGGANFGTSGQVLTSAGSTAVPTWAAAGGDNTPAFAAYLDATITTFPDEVWTKIAINAEDFDSDGAFDPTTNYRFTVPAGEGGKYFFTASATAENGNNDGEKFKVGIYKNGSRVMETSEEDDTTEDGWNTTTGALSGILVLSAADYIELYAYTRSQNGGGTPFIATGTHNTRLVGYKMIGL